MVSFDETGHSSVVIQHLYIFVTDKHSKDKHSKVSENYITNIIANHLIKLV